MNIFVLKLNFNNQGIQNTIYPVLLKNDKECFLVDCGYSGFLPLIEKAANLHGISLKELTGIIITHDDIDHVGGLYEIKAEYPSIKVFASEIEEPYISGKEKSPRLQQAEELYDLLPEDQKEGAIHFQEMLKAVKRVEVDYTFTDEEEPGFLPGIKIILTQGHTPGHISIFSEDSKTIVAADALVIENGEFEIANPGFTLDLAKAIESVKKLYNLKPLKIICYHGGIMENEVLKKLEKLINKYSDMDKL